MLDRMAWDPGIEGFFHIRVVLRSGTIQWHIWDASTCYSDNGEQYLERMLIQAMLEEKRFLEHWKNLLDEDATWEGKHILEHSAIRLLEGKKHLGGEDYHVPSQTHQ